MHKYPIFCHPLDCINSNTCKNQNRTIVDNPPTLTIKIISFTFLFDHFGLKRARQNIKLFYVWNSFHARINSILLILLINLFELVGGKRSRVWKTRTYQKYLVAFEVFPNTLITWETIWTTNVIENWYLDKDTVSWWVDITK